MKCFLTSSPMIPGTNTLNPENSFADKLRACLPSPCKALFICSDPDGYDRTFAELPAEVKDSISHRAKAFAQAADFIRSELSSMDDFEFE